MKRTLILLALSMLLLSACTLDAAPAEQVPPQPSVQTTPPPIQDAPSPLPQDNAPPPPSGERPPFNPFENMTTEQADCLRQAWGEEAFEAITAFQRPPTAEEEPAVPECLPMPQGMEDAGKPSGNGDQGPRTHQVMYATSPDGLTWQVSDEVIRDQASVPEVARLADGTLMIYFVDATPDDVRAVRRNQDGGWETVPFSLNNRPSSHAYDPDVVLLPDGSLRLFYFGPPEIKGNMLTEPHTIYSATSQDGLTFESDPGERITVVGATDPSVVILPDGTWLMALSRGAETLLASSSDGDTFTETGVVVTLGGVPELSVLPDGSLRLYVSSQGGIRSLISGDNGQTWAEETGIRVPAEEGNLAADPSVVQLGDGTWFMTWKRVNPDFLQ
ncbi:MAG: hypothetical protein GXP40_06665 [Chloroflexi bacterium]|nr:hypothetical protein [Chloroflexota bacterium]